MAWATILGHDAVRDRLALAAEQGRLAHAYLFVGPHGVGKQRFARELAKVMLCEAAPGPFAACDHCPACLQVEAGTHPDYFTAATPEDKHELPIDTVREFCQQLGLKPVRGPRKVGILETADDFNEESANAFLKTLEEPPPGSVLILLATSQESQLPTILSRCQVVPFHPLSAEQIRAVLSQHEISNPNRIDQLVRLANGSPGQALALNDEDLWGFRRTAMATLSAERPDPVGFSTQWIQFAEDAGKEAVLQRSRVSLVLRLMIDMYRAALRRAVGMPSEVSDPEESSALTRLSQRLSPDDLADAIEACLHADYLIERKVQLVLVVELIVDQLLARSVQSVSR